MSEAQHYRNLESMYAAAPVNEFYLPTMTVTEGEAVIEIQALKKHQHSAGGVHGSVYFKLLDDAAFFAANSLEGEMFVLTTSKVKCLYSPPVSQLTLPALFHSEKCAQ